MNQSKYYLKIGMGLKEDSTPTDGEHVPTEIISGDSFLQIANIIIKILKQLFEQQERNSFDSENYKPTNWGISNIKEYMWLDNEGQVRYVGPFTPVEKIMLLDHKQIILDYYRKNGIVYKGP